MPEDSREILFSPLAILGDSGRFCEKFPSYRATGSFIRSVPFSEDGGSARWRSIEERLVGRLSLDKLSVRTRPVNESVRDEMEISEWQRAKWKRIGVSGNERRVRWSVLSRK